MTLLKAIGALPRIVEIPVENVTDNQLNSLREPISDYDMSLMFRRQVIGAGYRIRTLIACYYKGWEMDEWAAIGEKDNKNYKITTNHGNLEIEEIV